MQARGLVIEPQLLALEFAPPGRRPVLLPALQRLLALLAGAPQTLLQALLGVFDAAQQGLALGRTEFGCGCLLYTSDAADE